MTSPVEVGDLIAEKFRVERVLGRGGMGVVVAAVHVGLGQHVAIKFLLPSVGVSAPILARFEREARAAVALHSEHVTRVLDVGRLPSGAPYMVMELLEGVDLAQELRTRRRLPAHEAVTYILQACDAIAEAHGLGIVHRDIKPANLFLARRPKRAPIVKVLDFGISKANTLVEGVTDITNTTELIGSPLYMSPEQLRAPKTVDARSDVWSLGATLYELVSGTPPFDGNTMAELSAHIMMTPLVPVRSRKASADIPEGLADVIARSLEKDRDKRFASVEDFANALQPFAKEAARAAPPDSTATSNPLATTTSPPVPARGHAGKTLPILPGPTAPAAAAAEGDELLPGTRVSTDDALASSASTHAVSEVAVSYPPPGAPAKGPPRRVPVAIAAGVLAIAGVIAVVAMKGLTPESGGASATRPASDAPLTDASPSATAPATATATTTTTASGTATATVSATAPAPPLVATQQPTIRAAARPDAAAAPPPVASSAKPAPPASAPPSKSANPLNLKLE